MPKKKPAPAATESPVASIRHKDKRKNIPTEELRDFVAEEEQAPRSLLYPRDPSLDPQLVWKGKDEQDRADLAVPIVPIYIQEKIHPQAIIDALPREEKAGDAQLNLFADFNGLPEEFDQRVDFYRHDGHWSNRLILGDSLLVMASLAEKEGLKGHVQTIYFDPPYGIRFGSNWQVSTRNREVKDGKDTDVTRQPEQVRAFRDTWELGIHSYLAYLRDRLVASLGLLAESGSVFVQIGDENVHLVRSLLDEVFGPYNFVSIITCLKTTGATAALLPGTADYILWYAKNKDSIKYRPIFRPKERGGEGGESYTAVETPDGMRRRLTSAEQDDLSLIPKGSRFYAMGDLTSPRVREGRTGYFEINILGRSFLPRTGEWKTHRDGIQRLKFTDRIGVVGDTPRYVRYFDDFAAFPLTNVWADVGGAADKIYVVQTAKHLVERCVLMTTDPGDLVLDPTCGSGTTAYVAEQWGRRWITTDTSRVALALARTRIMAAKFPFYHLADSPAGVKKEAEITGQMPPPYKTDGDIRKGFVCKRVPHVTLKSIANNEEIDAIHERLAPQLEKALAAVGKAAKKEWREWEVPRDLPKDAGEKLRAAHAEFWKLRRERQLAMDASIARRADTEILVNQPFEDKKTVRVAGPFTVESLSPHRTISVEEKKARAEVGRGGLKMRTVGPDNFGHMILDNLKKAGVQNTVKGERLKFDTLEPFAGEWIHGAGTYAEKDGKVKRAAICIGPEHGTVGPTLLKEAAKEAVRGVGFDLLVVCGFAFDPHVTEEAKRYGKLTVLAARMNPDLAMGDELLKKTGAGNLFMVFGEPDVEITREKGEVTVQIRGVDVYDPTTGEVRSNSTDDIACWFIDTEYNGESFFVRHAYFTGADKPYEKLQKALRAEIDEGAWSSLYRTTSRPFPRPASGKIAVKVINHYGDEVLKVFKV